MSGCGRSLWWPRLPRRQQCRLSGLRLVTSPAKVRPSALSRLAPTQGRCLNDVHLILSCALRKGANRRVALADASAFFAGQQAAIDVRQLEDYAHEHQDEVRSGTGR